MQAPPNAPQATPPSHRPPRPGPRPLPLHIATAATTWLSSAAALPLLRSASPNSTTATATAPEAAPGTMWAWLTKVPWHKTVRARADALQRDLAGADPDAFAAAVGREVRRRLDELATGLTQYRRHPYRRVVPDAPSVWHDGTTRLRDYGKPAGGRPGVAEDAPPVIVVPFSKHNENERRSFAHAGPGYSLLALGC